MRTIDHEPFHLDEHMDRLYRSLKAVGFPTRPERSELVEAIQHVVRHNARNVRPEDDLGIVVFVTAGQNLTYLGASRRERADAGTVCVHTFRLPFELWAEKLIRGQHLVTPPVRQMPADCVDPKIKCRSRMHYYLADRAARRVDPHASALLLSLDGTVTECSTANFCIVSGNRVITAPERLCLGGVSLGVIEELCPPLGLSFERRAFTAYDVLQADEAFTTSTPYCMLPVTRFNGEPIGDGEPGPVFAKLFAAWGRLVNYDLEGQLRAAASRAADA
ncbi:MAG: hypothetical protein D6725_17490 [Planctomycetota bacterium]|nr:MAG: hypothetical protein D6725_17490 [Planctomycetota bacterium]